MEDEILLMINDVRNRRNKLTPWEQLFADALNKQVNEFDKISDRQKKILEEIWDKITL